MRHVSNTYTGNTQHYVVMHSIIYFCPHPEAQFPEGLNFSIPLLHPPRESPGTLSTGPLAPYFSSFAMTHNDFFTTLLTP